MACSNSDFDITRYMVYLRDTDISEQEAYNLLQDVLVEVSFDTKIFKDLFVFDVDNCDKAYDIKALYNLSQALKQNVSTVTLTDYSTEELINILQGKEFTDSDSNSCSIPQSQDSDEDTYTGSNCLNTFINVIDLMWYNKDDTREPIKSVISSWFQMVGDNIFELAPDNISRDTGIPISNLTLNNSVKVIGYISVIPNIYNLTADDELLLRQVLIDGLKYKVSGMYLNANNEQVSNLLYQRYYSSKKQLSFNFPQFVSNQRIKNEEWNK